MWETLLIGSKYVFFWVVDKIEDKFIEYGVEMLFTKFMGKFGEYLSVFLLQWGFVSFLEAAEIIDSVTGAWLEGSYWEGCLEKEEYIKKNAIPAIEKGKLKAYKSFSPPKKEQLLEEELKKVLSNQDKVNELFIKNSDLYKYLLEQIKKTKKYKAKFRELSELEMNGNRPSRKYDLLKEEVNLLEREITNYAHRH